MLYQGTNATGGGSPLGQSGLQTGRPGTKSPVTQTPYATGTDRLIRQTPYATGSGRTLGQTPYSTGMSQESQGKNNSTSGNQYKQDLTDLIPSEHY